MKMMMNWRSLRVEFSTQAFKDLFRSRRRQVGLCERFCGMSFCSLEVDVMCIMIPLKNHQFTKRILLFFVL
jgi:hypothetical protein